jgi:hypothetical protein
MPRKSMIEAVRDAMDVMMERDDNVVVFGEDVGFFGGVFRATQGLQAKYGKTRCFDAPISELGIVGAAVCRKATSSAWSRKRRQTPKPTSSAASMSRRETRRTA